MHKFRELISEYSNMPISSDKAWKLIACMEDVFAHMKHHDEEKYWDVMKDLHVELKGEYFDEHYARHEVSKMFHTDKRGSRRQGEMFTIDEAIDIHATHSKHYVDRNYGHWDTYVAINAHYHDHISLYKTWFDGEEVIKDKIVEGAITFWMRDEDYGPSKPWKYFDD